MKEIELNYKVKDKKELLEYLDTHASKSVLNMKMEYFGPKDSTYAGENDNFYVRIEEIEENNQIKRYITAKGCFTRKGALKTCDEVTIPVDSTIKDLKAFLNIADLNRLGSKRKVRHLYKIDNMIVTLDEWDRELGDRIDIEGASEDELHEFAKKIKKFCD